MGYLDESVFLYCEEPILASRVKKYGYKELYVREITAYHMHHDSEKEIKLIVCAGFEAADAIIGKNIVDMER